MPKALPRVFVDLDGVIVNFSKGIANQFGVPYPTEHTIMGFDYIYNLIPNVTHPAFLAACDKPLFWESLDKFACADELISRIERVGLEWNFLTSATYDASSYRGKAYWVRKHFGEAGMLRLIVVCGNKGRIARPGDILIDDSSRNCGEWAKQGGIPFYWTECTDNHPMMIEQLDSLSELLVQAKNGLLDNSYEPNT